MVVFNQLRPLRTPDRHIWRINRSTVQRATRMVPLVEVVPHLVRPVGDEVLLVHPGDHRLQFGVTDRPR